jgi:hypothetical protein
MRPTLLGNKKKECIIGQNELNFKYILVRHQWLTPVILATQEDYGLKLAWANSSRDPVSKEPNIKTGLANGSSGRALAY